VLTIADGQVKEWREYYDRNWLLSEMGVLDAEPPHPIAPREPVTDADAMTDEERLAVAQAMLDAYENLDWEAAANLIADDGVIHYAEKDPMVGPDAMRAHTSRIGSLLTAVDFDIRNIGVVNGVVMIERHDVIEFNGHKGRVPVFGSMEIENGKIKVWREYFDHNQMMAAMGLAR
jgi:limonene-1,2-epoxide hydrolase